MMSKGQMIITYVTAYEARKYGLEAEEAVSLVISNPEYYIPMLISISIIHDYVMEIIYGKWQI